MTTPILSSRGRKAKKPSKPRKDFPLFAHASGQWAKKVRGKLYYFGTWQDHVAAEQKWDRDKEALLDGRNPDLARHGDSVGWLCNVFMDDRNAKCERGDLSKETLNDYHRVCKHVAAFLGKGRRLRTLEPRDFMRYRNSLPSSWAPTTTNNHLRYARAIFSHCNKFDYAGKHINYISGLEFASKNNVRKHAASQPAKEFSAAEIWVLHDASSVPMRAFILLGLNAAYGTADIGRLRIDAIDWKGSWLGEARGKTGVARGCWLWPETRKALRKAVELRPDTSNERLDQLAFLTRDRQPWFVDGSASRPLTLAFGKLKKEVGITKKGVGHYSLRHVFRTVADSTRDQPAIDYIMGHKDDSIQARYREHIDPERIEAVCKHVRKWWLDGKPRSNRERS